jgi:hypothetical protein
MGEGGGAGRDRGGGRDRRAAVPEGWNVHWSSSRVGCGKCSKKIIGGATGERCRFCIAQAPSKNFRIFFAAALKFRATRPITHSDDRDRVLKKIFAGTLKFRKSRPITLSDVRNWIEKKFVETLKFGKNHPITAQ